MNIRQPDYGLLPSGYVLNSNFSQKTGITGALCGWPLILLDDDGLLTTFAAYEWNGDNVVADHPRSIAASLGHDALYDLIDARVLDKKHRKKADTFYRNKLIESGYPRRKAWVRWFVLRARWILKDRSW